MTVTPDTLRADLEKALRKRHITVDPGAAADLSLGVVLPHMKKMAAEINRLRNLVEAYRLVTPGCSCGKVKGGSEGEGRLWVS